MRKRVHIFHQTVLLLIMAAMLLSACSSDDSEEQTVTAGNEPVGKVVQLMSYTSPFTEKGQSLRRVPVAFSAFTPTKRTDMGIYMLLPSDWASPTEKSIIYTNKWHAYFDVEANKLYTVYGYMPKTGEMVSTLTKSTDNAASLAISNIKAVSADDICIITGVQNSYETLVEGRFGWIWPIGNENYSIYLLMDHLYAAVRFSVKVDATYAELRTIKLKSMTLSTNKSSVNAEITLTHNTTGTSPVSGVKYTTTSGTSDAAVLFDNDEGVALDKTTATVIDGCFTPTLSGNLTLTTSYDVYDRYGNLVRANCTATNKLPILEATRGQRLQLNLTVSPTYLYVLSDPDLDNPTIKIS